MLKIWYSFVPCKFHKVFKCTLQWNIKIKYIERKLQCNYYNRGHLDKVGRSDYRKITIRSKTFTVVVSHNYHKKNKQHGSKSTNQNLQRWPFELAEESMCFPRGPLEWLADLTWLYLLTCSCMLLQSAAIRAKKLLVEIGLLGFVWKVASRKTLSVETFCFPGKRLL